MRNNAILSSALLLVLTLSPALGASYDNARFGFALVYPADRLAAGPEAANSDGRSFTGRIGHAHFAVYGAYRQDDQTPAALFNQAVQDCGGDPPRYKRVTPELVAMSCLHAGTIFYRRSVIVGDTMTTLTAAYPAGENAIWDGVVTEMARSLRLNRR